MLKKLAKKSSLFPIISRYVDLRTHILPIATPMVSCPIVVDVRERTQSGPLHWSRDRVWIVLLHGYVDIYVRINVKNVPKKLVIGRMLSILTFVYETKWILSEFQINNHILVP